MRAVVTGGAGFLGSHLCTALIERGDEVVCVDNLVTGSESNVAHLQGSSGFELSVADVRSGLDVEGPVDAIFHLASAASPQDYLALPLETLETGSFGTRSCLELSDHKEAVFLLASTSEVYGDPLVHPQVESYWGNVNPVGPRSVYDEAKRFAEALTMAYNRSKGVDVRIVRIFNTYGPRLRPSDGRVVSNFVAQALSGRPLTVFGDGTQTRSLCYVDDQVSGILALLSSGYVGPVNIGNPDEISVLDLAKEIIAATNSRSGLKFEPLPVDDPVRRRPDISLAREILGWEPAVDLATGLGRTIEWMSGEPY